MIPSILRAFGRRPTASPWDTEDSIREELFSIDLGGQILIEDNDLVIMVGKALWTPDEETHITVEAEIGASRIDSVPQLLVDLARSGGGMSHGAFTGLRHQ